MSEQASLSGKRVLVTGAGGFVGSHLTEALVRAGAHVSALVHYNAHSTSGNLALLPQEVLSDIEIVAGNIEDSEFMLRAVDGQDIVFHLAALIAIPYSYQAPRSYLQTNVTGTLNVLEAAKRCAIGRMVHTSTSEVYGSAQFTPMTEDHPLQAQSPYAATKIAADKMVESYWLAFAAPVVTLRPFNTFGPRQSARAFIPTIISQALWREQIMLGALDPERDMLFVADSVDAYLAAATADGALGQTVHVGSGEAHAIGAFAQRILALMGCGKPIMQDKQRLRPANSEVATLVADAGKAQRLLDWTPKTALDDGLRRTIEAVAARPELYSPQRYAV